MNDKAAMGFYGLAWNMICEGLPKALRIEKLKAAIANCFPEWDEERISFLAEDYNAAFEPEAFDNGVAA